MKISVYVSSLGAYVDGTLTGQWTDLPVRDVQKDIIDKIKGAVGEEYFISDYEAPFKIDEYEPLDQLNQLAQDLKDDQISNLEDLYWYLIDNVDPDDLPINQLVPFNDEDDLDEMVAGLDAFKVLEVADPQLNLNDDYLYWENGLLKSMDEFQFKRMLKQNADELMSIYIQNKTDLVPKKDDKKACEK